MAKKKASVVADAGAEVTAPAVEPFVAYTEPAPEVDSWSTLDPVAEAETPAAAAGAVTPAGPGFAPLLAAFRRKVVWIPVVAVVVLALAGTVGWTVYHNGQVAAAAQAAAKVAAADSAKKAEQSLVAQFDKVMAARTSLLAAEAQSAESISKAKSLVADFNKRTSARNKKVKKLDAAYDREYRRVDDWNHDMSKMGYLDYPDSPDYPDEVPAPSFSSQIKALKAADSTFRTATAVLSDMQTDAQFASLVTQFKEASSALSDEALHNADTLTTCVEPGEDDNSGYIDKKAFATLRTQSAKALLTLANDDCLKFIAAHKLDIRLYDVAGGRDVNAKDSSMLTSKETSAAAVTAASS